MVDKKEYYRNLHNKTNHKGYENMCIARILNKLDNLDLKPVIQQYIPESWINANGSKSKYALIDLYFPALNYAVEIDEYYHIENKENDKKREDAIKNYMSNSKSITTLEDYINSLNGNFSHPFILRRIDASKTLVDIYDQIEQIVLEIKTLIEEYKPKHWDISSGKSQILGNTLNVEDNIDFDGVQDVFDVFNYTKKGRTYKFKIKQNGDIFYVFSNISFNKQNGWENKYEINSGNHFWIEIDLKGQNPPPIRDKIILFAKVKDFLGNTSTKFLGVFELVDMENNNSPRIYKRIDTKFDLSIPFQFIK